MATVLGDWVWAMGRGLAGEWRGGLVVEFFLENNNLGKNIAGWHWFSCARRPTTVD